VYNYNQRSINKTAAAVADDCGGFYLRTGVWLTPKKPKRPCSHPGCPALTDGRFCEQHKQAENRRYNKYQRDPKTGKRYGSEWRKVRARFLTSHPLCELCHKDGRLTPAALVHHKRKLTDGGTHDADNLMALCDSCHSRLHAEQGDRWGN
jgi:5-methylcytosine-specific restriction protein A